jgi:hypothetical protein
MTKQLVIDSVFVRDFSKLGLLSSFLSLSNEIRTTSTACQRSEMPQDSVCCDGPVCNKIYVVTLTNDDLYEAFTLGLAFEGLSYADYTVLYIARRYGLELVTGDSRVHKVALEMEIVVHDYLWLFCEMVKAGVLALDKAVIKYYELGKTVNRLAIWEEPAIALKEAHQDYKQSA